MMIDCEYIGNDEYQIIYNGEVAGVFRFYESPEFEYAGKKLTRFLGYINVLPEFRRKGILRYIVEEYDIRSLMIDNIDTSVSIDDLIKIYKRLGFRLLEGSDRFVTRD